MAMAGVTASRRSYGPDTKRRNRHAPEQLVPPIPCPYSACRRRDPPHPEGCGRLDHRASAAGCGRGSNSPADGSGGARRQRCDRRGGGKRGGYRTVTFYTGEHLPVYLLTVFAKGEKSDLTQAERNALKEMTKSIVKEYAVKVTKVGARQ